MTLAIRDAIKKGSVKAVFRFGDSKPSASCPYICVKPEMRTGGIRAFRVSPHWPSKPEASAVSDLENYTLEELPGLLLGKVIQEKVGVSVVRSFQLADAEEVSDVALDPGDNTIYMERVFLAPIVL